MSDLHSNHSCPFKLSCLPEKYVESSKRSDTPAHFHRSDSRRCSAYAVFRKLVWCAASYPRRHTLSRRCFDGLFGRTFRAQPQPGDASGPTAGSDRRQVVDFRRADFVSWESTSAGLGGGNNYRPRVCSHRFAIDCSCGRRGDIRIEDGQVQDAGASLHGGAFDCFQRCGQTARREFRQAVSGDRVLVGTWTTRSVAAFVWRGTDRFKRLAGFVLYRRTRDVVAGSNLLVSVYVRLLPVFLSLGGFKGGPKLRFALNGQTDNSRSSRLIWSAAAWRRFYC